MVKNILIITGEPSGDMRGGELLRQLKPLLGGYAFWGIGGDSLVSEGVELIEHVRDLSVVGLLEAVKSLPKIRKQYSNVAKNVRKRRPALAILIDYPGFNLKVAKLLKKEHIPVVYYIVPQVWAWGAWRVKAIKKYVDKALVLFGFEKSFLGKCGITTEWTGHPIVDTLSDFYDGAEKRTSSVFTLALLPGSRKSEVEGLLPDMLDAAEIIKRDISDMRVSIAGCSNVDSSVYDAIINRHADMDTVKVMDNTAETLAKSDFAIVASGTATLEAAVTGKPMVITYRAPMINSLPYKLLVRTPFLGLVNIIAGKEICPELLQKDSTPEKIASKALEIITSPERTKAMKESLEKVKKELGCPGAAKRAAEIIREFMKKRNL